MCRFQDVSEPPPKKFRFRIEPICSRSQFTSPAMKECSSGTVPIGDHHIWPALDDESDLVRHPLVNSASKAFARNLPLRTFSNSYFVHEMVVFIVFVAVMQPSPRILRSYSITSLAYTPDRTYKTGNEQHFDAFRQCFVTK